MSFTAYRRFAFVALLAAGARACEYSADCTSPECQIEMAVCNWQYDADSYSDSGVPCGQVYGYNIECPVGGMPIAGPLSGFTFEALEAYQAEVQALLPIGENNKAIVPNDQQGAFLMGEGQCINATFIDEGACFLNKVGMITWDSGLLPGKGPEDYTAGDRVTVLENANLTVFFPNADSVFCNAANDTNCAPGEELAPYCTDSDPFLPLGTTVQLPPYPGADTFEFEAGVYVAFFIVVDAYPDVSKTDMETLDLGTDFHFTTTQLNDASENKPKNSVVSLVEQEDFSATILGVEYDFSDFVLVAFEDSKNEDYQDVVILLDFKDPVRITDPPTGEPCEDGFINDCGDVCCDPRCPSCGGCLADCYSATLVANANNTGDPIDCCPSSIRESGFPCSAEVPYGCILPDTVPCIEGSCTPRI